MYMRENELEMNELVIYRERKEEGNDNRVQRMKRMGCF